MKLPNVWKKYSVRIKFRDKLLGGWPRDKGALMALLDRMEKQGKQTLPRKEIMEELELATKENSEEQEKKALCGFRRNDKGLYVRGAMPKQSLKNWAQDLGFYITGRSASTKRLFHRAIFVKPMQISLGKKEPDGIYPHCGQVGEKEKHSVVSFYEYVEKIEIEFELWFVETCQFTEANLLKCFTLGQEAGMGALRPQDFGKFDLLELKKIEA